MSEVRANLNPPLYRLKDLKNDIVKGFFYREQLTKSPKPNTKDFFEVEKILKKKTVKGETFCLVKYLYYPAKFNEWIPLKNFSFIIDKDKKK